MNNTKRALKISFADEVFTQYDLKLLRELCVERKDLHRSYSYPRKGRDSINKCIRLLNRTLDKLTQ